LTLEYSPGQNATFSAEPLYECLPRRFRVNGKWAAFAATTGNRVCSYAVVDLSRQLRPGMNELRFDLFRSRQQAAFYFGPVLLGTHLLSTLAGLGLSAVAAAALLWVTRRLGLPLPTRVIMVAGLSYFLFWLHYHPNLAYTNDLWGHISYVRYMVDTWSDPYGYRGHEDFHPPLYYGIAARAYQLAAAFPIVNPLSAVRLLAVACYSVFLLAGLLTLRECATTGTPAYHAGTLLIAFWPVNILMATRINNDIALYAAWAAAFLALARWERTRGDGSLSAALCLVAVALMVKSNGALVLGTVGACLARALLKGEIRVASLWRGKLAWAWGALAAGFLINLGKPIYLYASQGRNAAGKHLGTGGTAAMGLLHFLRFDAASFLREPFVAFEREPSFLNFFLKTMLYGEFTFRHGMVASVLNGLLLAHLLVTLAVCLGLWRAGRQADLAPNVAGVAVPFRALVLFAALNRSAPAQDFRFVLPLLVPLVVLFVRGMEPDGRRRRGAAYWLGLTPAVALPILAAAFYIAQYVGLP